MAYEPGDFRDIEVRVHRAGSINNRHVPTLAILAHEEFPAGLDVAAATALFNEDAKAIADGLIASLPQAVLDRLTCRLLEAQASLLRVAFNDAGPGGSHGTPA